jgi:four helix bundle protein
VLRKPLTSPNENLMKKIEKFEELIAWQKARKLTARIYEITNEGGFAKDYGLRDRCDGLPFPVCRTSLKASRGGSLAEFSRFLSISKGSCAELRTQLYRC